MSRTFDLYDLIVIGAGMAGVAAAHLFVSRIGDMPAQITAFHTRYALQLAKHRLGAPETSTCKNCFSHF